MLLAAEDEEEGPRIKERLIGAVYKFIDIFCVWDCCHVYVRLAEVGPAKVYFITP